MSRGVLSDVGFSQVPWGLIRDDRIKPLDIVTYAALGTWASFATKVAWPSLRSISDRSGVSVNSTRASLHRLHECGWLAIEKRADADGRQMTNLYRLVSNLTPAGGRGAPRGGGGAPGDGDEREPFNESQIKRMSGTPDSPSKNGHIPYEAIVATLNSVADRHFRPTGKATRRHIGARWAEGWREDAFRAVVRVKSEQWARDPKMKSYLRPDTLFGAKFESYLNEDEDYVAYAKAKGGEQ